MTSAIEKKKRGGGPKTQGGKAASSKNATKHGLLSPRPVVYAFERREDYDTFCEGIIESLSPQGTLELDLAEQVASLLWRRKRITHYEAEMIAISIEEVDEKVGRVDVADEAHREKRLFERLPLLPDAEPVTADDALTILFHIETHAGTTIDEIDLPGIPEDADYEQIEWSGATLKGAISALAEVAAMEVEHLILIARTDVRWEAEEAGKRVVMLAEEQFPEKLRFNRIYRERILPDEKTLEKVQRYETHLTRQLNQTLHELEALQARRQGGSAPLARVDVQGLPGI